MLYFVFELKPSSGMSLEIWQGPPLSLLNRGICMGPKGPPGLSIRMLASETVTQSEGYADALGSSTRKINWNIASAMASGKFTPEAELYGKAWSSGSTSTTMWERLDVCIAYR